MSLKMRVRYQKSGKSRLNLYGTIVERKSIESHPKNKRTQRRERAHDLENQDASEDPRQGFNSRDSICFK
jgi:hypothetical protein